MCFGFSPFPSCSLILGYFEFSHSILDKFKAFCLTLSWSKSQDRFHTNCISSLAVQRMKTTLSFWEFGKEVIEVCRVQGCRLGWVTWCFSNINPWIFLRGPPEVTKSNQTYYQQMYIWNTGDCKVLLAGQWLNIFIWGGAQDILKWTKKWNTARKSSWAEEQGCLRTNIVRPVLGTLIYQCRLSQNSWVL